MSQTTEPEPLPIGAMAAAGSMGRFLARNPEFDRDDTLLWSPRASGDVRLDIKRCASGGPHRAVAIIEALGLPLRVYTYYSQALAADLVALRADGPYDGAQWSVQTAVPPEAWAAFLAEHPLAVAA